MDQKPFGNQGFSSHLQGSNPSASAAPNSHEQSNPSKKSAFKDMLRQRQTAIRNHRASSTTPSDTRSRRSNATAGYSNQRDYYPSSYEYTDGPSQSHFERGISLQSLREEASGHPQWISPSAGIVLHGPDPGHGNGYREDTSSGITIRGPPSVDTYGRQAQQWNQDRQREIGSIGQRGHHLESGISKESSDLRVLLTQNSSRASNQQNQDNAGRPDIKFKVY